MAAELGVSRPTSYRWIRRFGAEGLRTADGAPIRAARSTANPYKCALLWELVHLDVKKLGRIPDDGGWRALGRSEQVKGRGIGYDYVHVAIDERTRIGYAEVLSNEKGSTAAWFRARAAGYFAAHRIHRIERVITGHAFAYRNSRTLRHAVADLGAVQRFIKPRCPWTNGKAEWAYRQALTSSNQRQAALAPWPQPYNYESTLASEPHPSPASSQPHDPVNLGAAEEPDRPVRLRGCGCYQLWLELPFDQTTGRRKRPSAATPRSTGGQ
jgi:hypothetical protein